MRKTNRIKIPKSICHRLGWHLWWSPVHNKATIAQICKRCGMTGLEHRQLDKKKNPNKYL